MKRYVLVVTCLLTLALLVACGAAPGQPIVKLATPTTKSQAPVTISVPTKPPASQTAAVSRSTAVPTGPTNTALPSTVATPAANQLTILHTNDNWGETEPCG